MIIDEYSSKIGFYVEQKINKLKSDAISEKSGYKAELAELRKGVDHKPGEMVAATGILLRSIPKDFFGKGSKPSYEEWAVYIALTLFAVHQQSNDITNSLMHQKGQSIGKAIASLGKEEPDRQRIINKFNILLKSKDIQELSYYLKIMVYLLRSENQTLDYVALAQDLFKYQIKGKTDEIRLRWGQDFYANLFPEENVNNEEKTNE